MDDKKFRKLLVSVIGFGLVVLLAFWAKNRIIEQVQSLGPAPVVSRAPAIPPELPVQRSSQAEGVLSPPRVPDVGERRPTPDEAIEVLEATTPELKD